MPASVESSPRSDRQVGCYVYGILPQDVEVTQDSRGIGDRDVRLIKHGEIAALVSEIPLDAPIGKPEDLAAHQRLLDSAAVEAPVLPIRFGAVIASADAVTEELLAANHDEFAAALRELEGKVEYLLKARYDERAILEEVLADNHEAEQLREQLRGLPEDEAASRNIRIKLGELVNEGVSAKRAADIRTAVGALGEYAVTSAEREPSHHLDAAHVAFLVETDRAEQFEEACADLARRWQDRVDVRLLGPLAPYDFVVTTQEGG